MPVLSGDNADICITQNKKSVSMAKAVLGSPKAILAHAFFNTGNSFPLSH